jgi:hypothetical protein
MIITIYNNRNQSKPIAGDANVGDIITLQRDKANTDGNGPIIIFSRDRGKTHVTAGWFHSFIYFVIL